VLLYTHIIKNGMTEQQNQRLFMMKIYEV